MVLLQKDILHMEIGGSLTDETGKLFTDETGRLLGDETGRLLTNETGGPLADEIDPLHMGCKWPRGNLISHSRQSN